MAVLVKFAFNWPLLVRKGAVDGVVEFHCSLVVGRVDLNLSGLGYMPTGRAVRVVVPFFCPWMTISLFLTNLQFTVYRSEPARKFQIESTRLSGAQREPGYLGAPCF